MLPTYLYFISDGDIIYNFITLFKFQHSISILAEQQRIVSKLEKFMEFRCELEKDIDQSKEEIKLLLMTVLREISKKNASFFIQGDQYELC